MVTQAWSTFTPFTEGQYLNCEKRSGGTLEARRRVERRRRENRGAEAEGNGEGVSPSPTD